jgi:hypothetical protein
MGGRTLVAIALATGGLCGCHHSEPCTVPGTTVYADPLTYLTSASFCDITLYNPQQTSLSQQAVYRFTPSTPKGDAGVCNSGEFTSVDCTVQQGPTPTFCVEGGGCAQVGFRGAAADALYTQLGSAVYDMSINCDSIVRTYHFKDLSKDATYDPSGDPSLEIHCEPGAP